MEIPVSRSPVCENWSDRPCPSFSDLAVPANTGTGGSVSRRANRPAVRRTLSVVALSVATRPQLAAGIAIRIVKLPAAPVMTQRTVGGP